VCVFKREIEAGMNPTQIGVYLLTSTFTRKFVESSKRQTENGTSYWRNRADMGEKV
jgi:hypothetical protein